MIFRISQNPSINGEKPQAEAFLRSLSSEKRFGLRFHVEGGNWESCMEILFGKRDF